METKKLNLNNSEGQKKVKRVKMLKPAGLAAGAAVAGVVGQKILSKALRSKPEGNEDVAKDEELMAQVNPVIEPNDNIEYFTETENLPETGNLPEEENVAEGETQEDPVTGENVEEPNINTNPTPEEIDNANNKLRDSQIDPTDFNVSADYTVTGFTVLTDDDGNDYSAAVVENEDCVQYALADMDGDGFFESFFNREGYCVCVMEGSTITFDDLENMAFNDGGYLPIAPGDDVDYDELDHVHQNNTEDHVDDETTDELPAAEEGKPDYLADIIDTENGGTPDLALIESLEDENIIEELIGQLLDTDDEEDFDGEDLLAEEDIVEDCIPLDELDENA